MPTLELHIVASAHDAQKTIAQLYDQLEGFCRELSGRAGSMNPAVNSALEGLREHAANLETHRQDALAEVADLRKANEQLQFDLLHEKSQSKVLINHLKVAVTCFQLMGDDHDNAPDGDWFAAVAAELANAATSP